MVQVEVSVHWKMGCLCWRKAPSAGWTHPTDIGASQAGLPSLIMLVGEEEGLSGSGAECHNVLVSCSGDVSTLGTLHRRALIFVQNSIVKSPSNHRVASKPEHCRMVSPI